MYASQADLLKITTEAELERYVCERGEALTDDAPQARITEALDAADREIDAMIGVKVAVPVDPVPEILTDMAARIAAWNIALRLPMTAEDSGWKIGYDRAQKLLKAIAEGKATLGQTEPEKEAEPPDETSICVVTRPSAFPDLEDYGRRLR